MDVFFGNHEDGGGFVERLFVARNGGDLDAHQSFDIHLREVGRSLRVSGGDKRKDKEEEPISGPRANSKMKRALRALPHLRRARKVQQEDHALAQR